jgi:hydrogenase maturation protein HypF
MDCLKIQLPSKKKIEVLALGAQTKSSFCFVKKDIAYLSRPGGDLGEMDDLMIFENKIRQLKKALKARPRIIACDLHPEYTSTRLANEMMRKHLTLTPVQHHEAHVASCIIDNGLKAQVIGIAFDGTGLGLDGNIWGGEFFVGTVRGLKREAHLRYIPMPGGASSIKEPWRMALSYLYSVYGAGFKDLNIDFIKRLDKKKRGLLIQIIDKGINSPLTSSMGRLFDAVSSIVGICDIASHEGQAAIALEKAMDGTLDLKVKGYKFSIAKDRGLFIVNPEPLIRAIVKDLRNKVPEGIISLKFHNCVCNMIKEVCVLLRKKYKIHKVCLSGGVFQNRYLKKGLRPFLEEEGFDVYLHTRIPTHDSNIALGQAILALKG